MVLHSDTNYPQRLFGQCAYLLDIALEKQSWYWCRQWFIGHIIRMALHTHFGRCPFHTDDSHTF
jgi:hypothetical protein